MFIFTSIILSLLVALFGFSALHCQLAARSLRWKFPGMLLGAVVLLWCTHEGLLMLEGGLEKYDKLVMALLPLTLVGCWFLLDYHFCRAFGGLLVLLANLLLHLAFAQNCVLRPLYCLVVLFWGIIGSCMIMLPWWFRLGYEYLAPSLKKQKMLTALCWAMSVVILLLPFL